MAQTNDNVILQKVSGNIGKQVALKLNDAGLSMPIIWHYRIV